MSAHLLAQVALRAERSLAQSHVLLRLRVEGRVLDEAVDEHPQLRRAYLGLREVDQVG